MIITSTCQGLQVETVERAQIILSFEGDAYVLPERMRWLLSHRLQHVSNCEIEVAGSTAKLKIPSVAVKEVMGAIDRRTFVVAGAPVKTKVASVVELPSYKKTSIKPHREISFDCEARIAMAQASRIRLTALEEHFFEYLDDRSTDYPLDKASVWIKALRSAAVDYIREERRLRLSRRYGLRDYEEEDVSRCREDEEYKYANESKYEDCKGEDMPPLRYFEEHDVLVMLSGTEAERTERKITSHPKKTFQAAQTFGFISIFGAIRALRASGLNTNALALGSVIQSIFDRHRLRSVYFRSVLHLLKTPTSIEPNQNNGCRLWAPQVELAYKKKTRCQVRWLELTRRALAARIPIIDKNDFKRVFFALTVARKYWADVDSSIVVPKQPRKDHRHLRPSCFLRMALKTSIEDQNQSRQEQPTELTLQDRKLYQIKLLFFETAIDWLDGGPVVLASTIPTLIATALQTDESARSLIWRHARRAANNGRTLNWTTFKEKVWPRIWTELEESSSSS